MSNRLLCDADPRCCSRVLRVRRQCGHNQSETAPPPSRAGPKPAAGRPPFASSRSGPDDGAWRNLTGPILLTFEDRGLPRVLKSSAPLPAWVAALVNLGPGGAPGHRGRYRGWFTKPRKLREWLLRNLDAVGSRPVVFVDGSDVVWGGCADFERQIRRVARFPHDVIFSAEWGCDDHMPTPPGCAGIPPAPDSTSLVTRGAAGVELGRGAEARRRMLRWASCDAKGPAPCSEPPAYKFLNSGGMVGRCDAVLASCKSRGVRVAFAWRSRGGRVAAAWPPRGRRVVGHYGAAACPAT